MDSEIINNIIGIKESYELPEKLIGIMLSEKKNEILDEFIKVGEALDHDWFTEYFEETHANKTKMAQDFTPRSVCEIIAKLINGAVTIADVCAGTGGLTIGAWSDNRNAKFYCYELSQRCIPLLLLNLAIRNIEGAVIRTDILTGEVFEVYELTKAEKYSEIKIVENIEIRKVDAVISNPPYSMKYAKNENSEKQFGEYAEILPKNYADYCFVAYGLNIVKEGGKLAYILPAGVLFRANKEAECRKKIVEKGYLRAICGLPGKLFLNTAIQTIILFLQKQESAESTIFVDASKECKKFRRLNVMQPDNIEKISKVILQKKEIEKFSHLATFEEIKENDFNLNIPRYVDTFERPAPIDIEKVTEELLKCQQEIVEATRALACMVKELDTENSQYKNGLKKYIQYLENK